MEELSLVSKSESLPVVAGFLPKIILAVESGPAKTECQIEASNDLQAAATWIALYRQQSKTWNAYRREVERLLLWCTYERGLSLKQLKVKDFEAYFSFLKNVPLAWCTTRSELRQGKGSPLWRPFLGPLNSAAFLMVVRVLNSFLNYLVDAQYLNSNPLKLMRQSESGLNSFHSQDEQYRVWERMLEIDEWDAVQNVLETLPEDTEEAVRYKMRTQFLFAMLYLLGLRIEEVATHRWNAFKKLDGNWFLFVRGKGNKLRHIPVNDQLLSYIKVYRLSLKKAALPSSEEQGALLVSKRTGKALSIRQIYDLVKVIGREAAKRFENQPEKAAKLRKFSTHWLRHMSASHQDKHGIAEGIIQDNLGHASAATTKLYRHAENERRHQEMQKMTLKVSPRLIEVERQNSGTQVMLTFERGPVGEVSSLSRLLDIIEQVIWQGLDWERKGPNKPEILKEFEQKRRYDQGVSVIYSLKSVSKETLEDLKRAILRESEIRLFKCNLREGLFLE